MTLDERFVSHAGEWGVKIDGIRTTETSQLGFGTRGDQPVVLKVIRQENGEEWRCGEVLEAFRGEGLIRPIKYAAGAVLLPHLQPGQDLTSLCLEGRDEEATEVIASLLQRMSSTQAHLRGVRPVDRLAPEFAQFRDGAKDFIPPSYVDRAEALFMELCATQRNVRLLHGDLHHANVLFDRKSGWTVIDPWGVVGEIEFEIGAALRNPIDVPSLLAEPDTLERRLRIYETTLNLNAQRALQWAFATAVLAILWPFDPKTGLDLRAPFAVAARSMVRLLQ
jgi:streptomycin 6-kinase